MELKKKYQNNSIDFNQSVELKQVLNQQKDQIQLLTQEINNLKMK